MDEYYLYTNNEQTGPYTIAQLQHMWRVGQVTGKTLYWQEGFDEWIPLSTLADALESPPPQHMQTVCYGTPPRIRLGSDKRILPALLLCFFVGILGAHRFYAGKILSGFLLLFAGVVFVTTLVTDPSILSVLSGLVYSIWWLIDFISIIVGAFTDQDGVKITQWT